MTIRRNIERRKGTKQKEHGLSERSDKKEMMERKIKRRWKTKWKNEWRWAMKQGKDWIKWKKRKDKNEGLNERSRDGEKKEI